MENILSRTKKIHLIGVGGAGMRGLAMLLKDKGYVVSGSDIKDSFYLKELSEYGIEVFVGHSRKNISGSGLVCYSSAIKKDNIEILEAKKMEIPLMKRGNLLGEISKDKKVIAVAGSHGKTTTSALLTFLLVSLGYKPAAFIGAQPINYHRPAWWGKDFFVIEADESDASFFYYYPWVAIITNVDKEHLDFYKHEAKLEEAFLKFAGAAKGLVIGWGDLPALDFILNQVTSLKYGFCRHNNVRAENITFREGFTYFDLIVRDKKYERVRTSLLGEHNVLNVLAAISFFYYIEEDIDKVLARLEFFKSTRRRFQIKDKVNEVTFIDDYAHHPTEIKATLKAAKWLNPKRLVVIFQPHRFSRLMRLYKEFINCFSLCDCLILTDIYPAGEILPEGFDKSSLERSLKRVFPGKLYYFPKNLLVKEISSLLEEGDLVLGLGAGDINFLLDDLIGEFKKNKVRV